MFCGVFSFHAIALLASNQDIPFPFFLSPRCPIAVHLKCTLAPRQKDWKWCSHHSCCLCRKAASQAGGFLYPCSGCCAAYCEDHLPKEAVVLHDGCERMEKLGYHLKQGVFVLCSTLCENVAKKEFGWKPQSATTKIRDPCPPALKVSSYFGRQVDDSLNPDEDGSVLGKGRRRRSAVNYTAAESPSDPAPAARKPAYSKKPAAYRPKNIAASFDQRPSAKKMKQAPITAFNHFNGNHVGTNTATSAMSSSNGPSGVARAFNGAAAAAPVDQDEIGVWDEQAGDWQTINL